MDIRPAMHEDIPALARLLWCHASAAEQARQSVEAFAVDLAAWWSSHGDTHLAFIAQTDDTDIVGMAWLALVPRPPRPDETERQSADIQSVFVMPEHRGNGVGSALVQAAVDDATRRGGVTRVTVSSGRKAVALYERLGFASSRQLLEHLVVDG